MNVRPYQHPDDKDAVQRIWTEVGWMRGDSDIKALHLALEFFHTRLALLNDAPECAVSTLPGEMNYLDETIPMDLVGAVTTSHIARRRGLASRLTAQSIAESVVERGMILSGLGMFDQGYYDRLGYGTGSYMRRLDIDPVDLLIPDDIEVRVPVRLNNDDYADMHAGRMRRARCHGSVVFPEPRTTQIEAVWTQKGFGFGYRGEDGALTHHIWMTPGEDAESGPYQVRWMAYETREQLLELLGLIRNLGDQVHTVRIYEPVAIPIQLQSLLRTPFRRRGISRGSTHAIETIIIAWWQMRVCDVEACLAKTKIPHAPETRFNLGLTDPIEGLLDDGPWRGVAGEYVVTLGEQSHAERARDSSLPTLSASVNSFTRLWLGVGNATGLAVTDDLKASDPRLLKQLDATMASVPQPQIDWDF